MTAISPRNNLVQYRTEDAVCTAQPYDSRRNKLTRPLECTRTIVPGQRRAYRHVFRYSRATAGITEQKKETALQEVSFQLHHSCVQECATMWWAARTDKSAPSPLVESAMLPLAASDTSRDSATLVGDAQERTRIPDLHLAKHTSLQDSPIVQH